MKNKLFIYLLFLGIMILTSIGCKKYDENPLITTSSVESRLCQSWISELLIINNNPTLTSNWWISLDYDKNGTVTEDMYIYSKPYSHNWEFLDKSKTKLSITGNVTTGEYLKIIRLTKNQFWFIVESPGNKFEYHMRLK